MPTPRGGVRFLGIPVVVDWLIHQAVAQVLIEICDPDFSKDRDGVRSGRSAHDAVYKAWESLTQSSKVAVDMDLAQFVDTVTHDVLMCRVAGKIHDKRVLRLIGMVPSRRRLHRWPSAQDADRCSARGAAVAHPLERPVRCIGQRAGEAAASCRPVRGRFRDLRQTRPRRESGDATHPAVSGEDADTDGERGETSCQANRPPGMLRGPFKKTSIGWSDRACQEFTRRITRDTGRSWGVSMSYRLKKLASMSGAG